MKYLILFIIVTLLVSLLFLNLNKTENKVLVFILFISCLNELLSSYIMPFRKAVSLNSSLYAIVLFFCWLLIILNAFKANHKKKILFLFLSFSIYNLFFLDGTTKFNTYTFLIGSSMYLICFLVFSLNELKKDNLFFFTTNTSLLISSPILFFIGFGLIFSIKSNEIDRIIIFGKTDLYTFISNFVNIIYYSLINLYIYKERKLQDG